VKARSLVIDLFGDYLRYRAGQARLRSLIAVCGAFGLPESTVRVATSRLRKDGWLTAARDGRETVYALTPHAVAMLDEGRTRIFQRAAGPWDGQWHMVIYQVPETDRPLREQLRRRLSWLGFGSLAPSVWVSPHDRTSQVREEFAGHPSARLDIFRSRSAGAAADRDIASRAWDLPALDRDYTELLDRYRPRLDGYREGTIDDRAALVERTHLISDYRRFPFRDPDLPPELLPAGWPGRAAHDVFLEAHGLLRIPAERAVDELTETIEPRRPAADIHFTI
jgi:phenylacetic acid degradation operon negative regulatory protein